MKICIDSLVPFEKILTAPNGVFELVDKEGTIILLKNNLPTYIVSQYKYVAQVNLQQNFQTRLTLHEAMKIVLQEAENQTLHAAELADIIFHRGLYFRLNGGMATYTQIRARAGRYPNLFEALPGNFIKLRGD